MSVTSDLAKALDKAYEEKSLKEILDPEVAAVRVADYGFDVGVC